jgi:hypothetical protein
MQTYGIFKPRMYYSTIKEKIETGYVARTWEMRNALILVRKLESRDRLREA